MTATADSLLRNKDITLALSLPVPEQWTDDEDESQEAYVEAEQPARIGRALIKEVHTDLANAKIGYLFRETMAERTKTTLAKASKVGAKLRFYSGLDFIIEVNYEAWGTLTDEQKVALIDHELYHFGIDDDGKFILLPHDLEEFGAIVRRWGLWKSDIKEFGRALADQGDLFSLHERDNAKVTFRAGDSEPVELTSRQLEEAADRISGKRRK